MTTINSAEQKPASTSRSGAKAWLIISQIIAALFLLPWVVVAGLSFMAFDSGVSTGAVVFVSIIVAYPIVAIVCGIIAWLLYRSHKDKAAVIVTSLFLIYPIMFVILVFIAPLLPY
jgi:uncharacterized membrane protein